MKLSLVIPCYNEALNIPIILEKLRALNPQDLEAILVDNGSTDDTPAVLKEQLGRAENFFAHTVRVEKNIGYGFGIISGVRSATGEIIAWTHADLQTDMGDVFRGYKLFLQQKEIKNTFLKGKRKQRTALDEFFTAAMAVISSLALGERLWDINAQPKMFHRNFLEKLKAVPNDFSLDLYALYQAQKYKMKILELPVYFNKRIYGKAKGGGSFKTKIKLIKRTFSYIFELRKSLKSQG